MTFRVHYRHYDCAIDPSVVWDDSWSSAVNSPCPACSVREIEPVAWHLESDECDFCDPSFFPSVKPS
jgi:hypothetical protein